MAFELITSLALLVFFVFCYFSIGMLPDARPGEMSSKAWPQTLLVLLVLCSAANIYGTWRKGRSEGKSAMSEIRHAVQNVNMKFIIGIALCFAYPVGLKYSGFIPTSVLFILAYMTLLGESRWRMRVTISFSITFLLYVIFRILLQVPLSRGMGFFRSFALGLERLFQ